MGSFNTDYAENLLDTLTGMDGTYLALFTAAPGDAGAVTDEVSSSDYDRQDISSDWESAGATNPREINSNAEVTFAKGTESWGTVTHLALCAAGTEGTQDLKAWGALTNQKAIDVDDQLIFESGNLTIKILAG